MNPWTAALQASLFLTFSQSLPNFMSTEPVMPSNHLIFCHPLLLLPSIFPSIRLFSIELAVCIRWPEYGSFSFSISTSPFNEYSELIPFRWTGWLSLLSKGLSRVFSSTTVQKHQFFGTLTPFGPTLTSIHDCWKDHSLDYTDLCQQSDVSAFQYTV